jgi:hypothetical protein
VGVHFHKSSLLRGVPAEAAGPSGCYQPSS